MAEPAPARRNLPGLIVRFTTALMAAAAGLSIFASPVRAQDPLTAARELYAAAAYEDLLTLLETARSSERRSEDRVAIEQYRALSLLALGRAEAAEQAIEAIVRTEPLYRPGEDEASPTVRAAFRAVRVRMLPGLVEQRYSEARAAFERKALPEAAEGFDQVLEMLGDSDLAEAAGQPPLSDLQTLAAGFRDLIAAALTPPPVPEPEPVPEEPGPAMPPRVYATSDPDVVPPATVRQVLPPFPAQAGQIRQGRLEVVIDERGEVESALMRTSVSPAYDRLVLEAARSWQYKPATRQGVPVKFLKVVQISIVP